jgi:hypothetical protein
MGRGLKEVMKLGRRGPPRPREVDMMGKFKEGIEKNQRGALDL